MFSAGELAALYPLHDLDRAAPLLIADTWERVGLALDGADCDLGTPSLRLVEEDGLALEGTHGCPAGGGTLTVVGGHLQGLEVGHETEIEVAGRIVGMVDRSSPIARVELVRESAGLGAWWALAVVPALAYVVFVGWRSRRQSKSS